MSLDSTSQPFQLRTLLMTPPSPHWQVIICTTRARPHEDRASVSYATLSARFSSCPAKIKQLLKLNFMGNNFEKITLPDYSNMKLTCFSKHVFMKSKHNPILDCHCYHPNNCTEEHLRYLNRRQHYKYFLVFDITLIKYTYK